MSQAGIINTTSGPVPPSVATQYVTDSGTAIPALNILNVNGANGITVSANPNGSNNILITAGENTLVGTVTTIGAVTGDVITFSLGAVPGVYTFDCKIAGFAVVGGPLGSGYTIVGSVRTTGAAAVLIQDQAVDHFEEGILIAGSAVLTVSGNNAIFRVTGTAATTIHWKAVSEYIFVS
jgi:hypothetical protein